MTTNTKREIRESPIEQGTDEDISYQLDTSPWGGSPTSVEVVVYEVDGNTFTDVTATVCTGAASVNGDMIILPSISNLEAGKTYRVEILFSCGVGQLEAWGVIYCTR